MLMINYVSSAKAPEAIGPYSQAIESGDFIFCSGQIGVDPATGELVEGIERQSERVLKNLQAVLKAAGSDLGRVVKTTVYLADINDFAKMNKVYAKMFDKHKPARATVAVANLPKGASVEIDALAVRIK